MAWLLKKPDSPAFVARRGERRSYVSRPEQARIYDTREEAQADACGNEIVVQLTGFDRGSRRTGQWR